MTRILWLLVSAQKGGLRVSTGKHAGRGLARVAARGELLGAHTNAPATTSPEPSGNTASPLGQLNDAAVPRPSWNHQTLGEPPMDVVTHVSSGAAEGDGVGVGVATGSGEGLAAHTTTRTTWFEQSAT